MLATFGKLLASFGHNLATVWPQSMLLICRGLPIFPGFWPLIFATGAGSHVYRVGSSRRFTRMFL